MPFYDSNANTQIQIILKCIARRIGPNQGCSNRVTFLQCNLKILMFPGSIQYGILIDET